MIRVSLSDAEKSIDWILVWYQKTSSALRERLTEERIATRPHTNAVFWGLTTDEVSEFFLELDYLTILDLLSATEAALRVDFVNRVHNKEKDDLSRTFRGFAKQYDEKISLEDHILDAWVAHRSATKAGIMGFKDALKLRHWLAHGRYWTAKLARKEYSPNDVFDICNELLHKTQLA